MTTYEYENKKYLKSIPYSNLLNEFKKYFDTDDLMTRELIDELNNTIMGKKILKKFIIDKFSNPYEFMISELEEIFN